METTETTHTVDHEVEEHNPARGLYVGPSHAEGGIPVMVDGVLPVEVEGKEYKICRDAYNSDKKLTFKSKTNIEILDYIHGHFSCQFDPNHADSGDFIICKLAVGHGGKATRTGTAKEILDEIQGEHGCRLSTGDLGAKADQGGQTVSIAVPINNLQEEIDLLKKELVTLPLVSKPNSYISKRRDYLQKEIAQREQKIETLRKPVLDAWYNKTYHLAIATGDLTFNQVKEILSAVGVDVTEDQLKLGDGGKIPGKYADRIVFNLAQMGTESNDWKSTPIKDFMVIQNEKGKDISVPIFDLPPSTYKVAPTLFPNVGMAGVDSTCCELCGKTPIKIVYHIQNDKKQWTMAVGSECVTHFMEGKSGDELARERKLELAKTLDNTLSLLARFVKKNCSRTRVETNWRGGKQDITDWFQFIDITNYFDQKSYHTDIKIWRVAYEALSPFGYLNGRNYAIRTFRKDSDDYKNELDKNEKALLNWYTRNSEKQVKLIQHIDKILKGETVGDNPNYAYAKYTKPEVLAEFEIIAAPYLEVAAKFEEGGPLWVGESKARKVFTKIDVVTEEAKKMAEKKSEAIDIIDEYYQGFTPASVKRAMIQSKTRDYGGGMKIGVSVKAEPYADQFSVGVNGIVGPYNVEISDRGHSLELEDDAYNFSLGKNYQSGLPSNDELIDDFCVLDLLASFPAKAIITRDLNHSLVYPTARELFETGYMSVNRTSIAPITVEQAIQLYNSGTVEKAMLAKTESNKSLPPSQKNSFAADLKNSITELPAPAEPAVEDILKIDELPQGDDALRMTVAWWSAAADTENEKLWYSLAQIDKELAELDAYQKGLTKRHPEKAELTKRIDDYKNLKLVLQSEFETSYFNAMHETEKAAKAYLKERGIVFESDSEEEQEFFADFWSDVTTNEGREYYWSTLLSGILDDMVSEIKLVEEFKMPDGSFVIPEVDSRMLVDKDTKKPGKLEWPVRDAVDTMMEAGITTDSSGFHTGFSKSFNGFLPCWAIVIVGELLLPEIEICFRCGVIAQKRTNKSWGEFTDLVLPYSVGAGDLLQAKRMFDHLANQLKNFRDKLWYSLHEIIFQYEAHRRNYDGKDKPLILLFKLENSYYIIDDNADYVKEYFPTENYGRFEIRDVKTRYVYFREEDLEKYVAEIAKTGRPAIAAEMEGWTKYKELEHTFQAINPESRAEDKLENLWQMLMNYEKHLKYGSHGDIENYKTIDVTYPVEQITELLTNSDGKETWRVRFVPSAGVPLNDKTREDGAMVKKGNEFSIYYSKDFHPWQSDLKPVEVVDLVRDGRMEIVTTQKIEPVMITETVSETVVPEGKVGKKRVKITELDEDLGIIEKILDENPPRNFPYLQFKAPSELYGETDCVLDDIPAALANGMCPCGDGTAYHFSRAELSQLEQIIEGSLDAFTPLTDLKKPFSLIALMGIDGNRLILPAVQFSQKDYADVKRTLEKAGGKYRKNGFDFEEDAGEVYDRLLNGEEFNLKKKYQYFPTPDKIGDEVVELAKITCGISVFEPEAGKGALIDAIHRKCPDLVVDCCEIMEINRNYLKKAKNINLVGSDFLEFKSDKKYDRIVANPPFHKNLDVIHIRKMYDFLKMGGRLVAISSTHWQFGKEKVCSDFRDWIRLIGGRTIPIPPGAFRQSGTLIESLIVIIDKK